TYYLGNLFYDKLQWERAVELWRMTAQKRPSFPTAHRNLALAYYNKAKDTVLARQEMETAFLLDTSDARVFLELDQLYKRLGMSF
ncbi:MAG: tetratricopeptide repeat protein, partial [Lachnospiraceae bacterium]|nr:tetratricopeptide repeat protein [Lachnospiraceae bacterium]